MFLDVNMKVKKENMAILLYSLHIFTTFGGIAFSVISHADTKFEFESFDKCVKGLDHTTTRNPTNRHELIKYS